METDQSNKRIKHVATVGVLHSKYLYLDKLKVAGIKTNLTYCELFMT